MTDDTSISDQDWTLFVIALIIHSVTLCLLMIGARFVYKATKLTNKFIIAMIVFLIIGVVLHIVERLGLALYGRTNRGKYYWTAW